MQLEFHQLERRGEHLRVHSPQELKRLLVSLLSVGQQTPIVVVPMENQPNRYVVIDGDKRIAALQQMGRDTVEAVIWPMTEAEAVVLDCNLRWSKRERLQAATAELERMDQAQSQRMHHQRLLPISVPPLPLFA